MSAPAHAEEHIPLSVVLAGIDGCLRRWKVARHQGQAVLTGLSNALLLRTYVDMGRGGSSGDDGSDVGGSAAWGVLANAGDAVSRFSVSTEARVRLLHGDLSALQDAMLAAAKGVRQHAQDARRRCFCSSLTEEHSIRSGSTSVQDATATAAAESWTSTADDERAADLIAVGGGYGLIDVADAASDVADMLLKEALVTATVAQGVGECRGDREALTVYAAAWTMQPYIDARRVKELETMVAGRRRA